MPHTPTLVERVQTAIELARGVEAQQDGAVSSFDLATVAVAEMRGRPASLEEMRHRIELTLDELTGAVLNDPKFVKIAAAIEDLTAAWVRLGGAPPAEPAPPHNIDVAAMINRAAAFVASCPALPDAFERADELRAKLEASTGVSTS